MAYSCWQRGGLTLILATSTALGYSPSAPAQTYWKNGDERIVGLNALVIKLYETVKRFNWSTFPEQLAATAAEREMYGPDFFQYGNPPSFFYTNNQCYSPGTGIKSLLERITEYIPNSPVEPKAQLLGVDIPKEGFVEVKSKLNNGVLIITVPDRVRSNNQELYSLIKGDYELMEMLERMDINPEHLSDIQLLYQLRERDVDIDRIYNRSGSFSKRLRDEIERSQPERIIRGWRTIERRRMNMSRRGR